MAVKDKPFGYASRILDRHRNLCFLLVMGCRKEKNRFLPGFFSPEYVLVLFSTALFLKADWKMDISFFLLRTLSIQVMLAPYLVNLLSDADFPSSRPTDILFQPRFHGWSFVGLDGCCCFHFSVITAKAFAPTTPGSYLCSEYFW
jgi:hypothetical protein